MPRINAQGKIGLGRTTAHALSYDGNILYWDVNAPTPSLVGSPIFGEQLAWVSSTVLIFTVPGYGLYTYNINTRATALEHATDADILVGNGTVWAAWKDGTGYFDSASRTDAAWVPVGVDDDGTVLVYLSDDHRGLAYLTTTDTTPIVISRDQILNDEASIRRGIVIFRANGVLNRYRIAGANSFLNTGVSQINLDVLTESVSSTTSVPVQHFSNDGNYVVGWHTGGFGLVVFKFGSTVGWILGDRVRNYNPDIRILSDGRILVATSSTDRENSADLTRYVVDTNDPQYYLFLDQPTATVINSSVPDTRGLTPDTATDVITTYQNTASNSGQGVGSLILSSDWFGANGDFIRGAWQYGVTAVVATTNTTGDDNVTVKNSSGNTYSSGRSAYGDASVIIRPDTASTNTALLWEVTWVANATTYSRVTLNANLANTTAITNTTMTFDTSGLLDLYANGMPIATVAHESEWYGYVKIRWATTRGDWTIGQDASSSASRLIAWNSARQEAYVVWNGETSYPSRLALEYDIDGNPSAVVNPAQQSFLIRESQFLPLTRTHYETGATPGIPTSPTTSNPPGSVPSTAPEQTKTTDPTAQKPLSAKVLMSDTRVFREPQSIVPPPSVLQKLDPASANGSTVSDTATGFASTVFGTMPKTFSEDPPSYDPKYPYNTVIHESESGHLIEADDSPGAERIHIMHRSGSHIEMRPDGGIKYKAVQKRQDVTIADHEIYVAGDCNIITEGGYTIHIRKGELVIDAKQGASINVQGQLKMHADNIELKAKNNIFLNAPKVDIGAIAPGSRPMMSIPQGILPYPPTSPVTFVPKVIPGLVGATTFTKLPSVKDAVSKPGKLFAALSNTSFDVAGEPAFSRLTEQPTQIPLSNPKVYTSTSTPERIRYRDRVFDTPEDVTNHEAYSSHINLCLEMEDYIDTAKDLPGEVYESDTTLPAPEPAPPLSFPLVSGGTALFTHNSTTVTGSGTMFTEDVLEGHTIRRGDSTVTAVIRSIQDDTTLVLSEPWSGMTGEGAVEVYRLRPFKEFFGTYTYTDAAPLGASGLTLGSMLINFNSPVFEVPKINSSAYAQWSGGGGSAVEASCGKPDSTIPIEFGTVQRIFAQGTWDLTKIDGTNGCGAFVEAVLAALPAEWGHIKKNPGQKQYNGHAVDALIYKSRTRLYNGKIGQVVDFIVGAGDSNAKIGWSPTCAPDDASLWYR